MQKAKCKKQNYRFINEDDEGIDMVVLVDKKGSIVATHSIKISDIMTLKNGIGIV